VLTAVGSAKRWRRADPANAARKIAPGGTALDARVGLNGHQMRQEQARFRCITSSVTRHGRRGYGPPGGNLLLTLIARVRNGSAQRHRSADPGDHCVTTWHSRSK
jgi:hypothetical protein